MSKNIVLQETDPFCFYSDCLVQSFRKIQKKGSFVNGSPEEHYNRAVDDCVKIVIDYFNSLDFLQPVEGDLLPTKFESLIPER